MRVSQILEHPCKGSFDLRHLQTIHKFLFRDVYPWAGKLRTVNIAKGNQFCNCLYLESGSQPIFIKLREEDHYLINCRPENVAEKLAYYLGEINVIHPFREGNGRTQRVFIQYLAAVAGYYVDFSDVSAKEMIEASAQAFDCYYRSMTALFQRITVPIPATEQEQFIHSIALKNSPVLAALKSFPGEQTLSPEEEEGPRLS